MQLLLVLLVPVWASAAISEVNLVRNESGYSLTWRADEPVNLSASGSPDMSDPLLLGSGLQAGRIDVEVPASIVRPYFQLASGTELLVVAERLLPLEGGRNFRDLGGYSTPEGKRVKWGRLFRSGYMAELTAQDYEYLSHLGIKVVCDLRSTSERKERPTRWDAPGARYLSWDYEMASSGLREVFSAGNLSEEMTRQFMLETYHNLAIEQKDRYRQIFEELASGNIPLAFNCSAGKVRAGMGAALILTALGVERSQVVHDYSLSETFVDYMADYSSPKSGDSESLDAALAQLPPEVLRPVFRSDPRYLEAAFAAIAEQFGSVDAYIENELQVSDQQLLRIRHLLLK